MQASAEALSFENDDEIRDLALCLTSHELGEAIFAGHDRRNAELLAEVPLRVVVHDQDVLTVFSVSSSDPSGDGGLAHAALLIDDDLAPRDDDDDGGVLRGRIGI